MNLKYNVGEKVYIKFEIENICIDKYGIKYTLISSLPFNGSYIKLSYVKENDFYKKIEPQEHKIGMWSNDCGYPHLKCTVCGEEENAFATYGWKFCPNCGARMIEEDDTDG